MEDQNIKSLYVKAERYRQEIESSYDSSTDTYRQNLLAAIESYEECRKLVDRLALFSPNESSDDISSGDLQCASLVAKRQWLDMGCEADEAADISCSIIDWPS